MLIVHARLKLGGFWTRSLPYIRKNTTSMGSEYRDIHPIKPLTQHIKRFSQTRHMCVRLLINDHKGVCAFGNG